MLIALLVAALVLWSCGAVVVLALCRTARLGDELEMIRTGPPAALEPLTDQRSATVHGGLHALRSLTGRSA